MSNELKNPKLSSFEIRNIFLDFFKKKQHQVINSSSLVPGEDPTLLFTNAGMNQFKDVFLGFDKPSYTRATSSQKCVRAGGKHNDLENVGYTARHHTFFEMLGNFSFGDYFKHDAIQYAWELLTDVYKIPKEKLLVTVYNEDYEAYDIWTKVIGISKEKIIRIGDNKGSKYASDNFWMMGDTGPCGPCTEVFYDHGNHIPGGPPGSKDQDGDRFIEIWNIVFMQYNRDEKDFMHPLPKPSVDTGMGLERISAVLQGVHTNYETDLFVPLIESAAKITKTSDLYHPSLKVLSDHIRACTFLISDGVIASNEGRGYVLRRIIRRAIRHGYKLGCRQPFFHKLTNDVIRMLGETYPDIIKNKDKITLSLKQEEERFFETIENGMNILEESIHVLLEKNKKTFDGQVAFKLHDTFGFPLDLTADICREKNITIDQKGFDAAMEAQKLMARSSNKFKMKINIDYNGEATVFNGYNISESKAEILAIFKDDQPKTELLKGESGIIILNATPFYAESGGQVGDRGVIKTSNSIFVVEDTQKIKAKIYAHYGVVEKNTIKVADEVIASVEDETRKNIMRNHSATHLLHKGLKNILGTHVEQKGSLVDDTKTRFDFSHPNPLSVDEIKSVEMFVNQEILKNTDTEAKTMSLDEAKKSGAMMLFGEKYSDEVRVLTIGSSKELCGGTHVNRTGDIGAFKIISETGISSGIRRIEATTGLNVIRHMNQHVSIIDQLAHNLKVSSSELPNKISQLIDQIKEYEKNVQQLKSKITFSESGNLAKKAISIGEIKVIMEKLGPLDAAGLRETIDKLKSDLKSAVIILSTVNQGKVTIAVGVTNDLTQKIKAGDIASELAFTIGGKGGGKPDLAMAGGSKAELLDKAFDNFLTKLKKTISN
ncbi:MAG: alanine--tRNA ligase [Candidatus Methylopumilus sp.]|nr:alanine--tRNA ligase [Candidatus Methylopumilus sp.]